MRVSFKSNPIEAPNAWSLDAADAVKATYRPLQPTEELAGVQIHHLAATVRHVEHVGRGVTVELVGSAAGWKDVDPAVSPYFVIRANCNVTLCVEGVSYHTAGRTVGIDSVVTTLFEALPISSRDPRR